MLHNSASVMERQRAEDNIPDLPLFTHGRDRPVRRERSRRCPTGHAKELFTSAADDIGSCFTRPGHVAGAAGGGDSPQAPEAVLHRRLCYFSAQTHLPGRPSSRSIILDTLGHRDHPWRDRSGPDREGADPGGRAAARTVINETSPRGGLNAHPGLRARAHCRRSWRSCTTRGIFNRLVDCPIFGLGTSASTCSDYYDDITSEDEAANFTRQTLKDLKVRPLPRKVDPGTLPEASALYVGQQRNGRRAHAVVRHCRRSPPGQARNTIGFVGYCDPDTPGGRILAAQIRRDIPLRAT